MYRLELPIPNQINLLIGRITQSSVRITALAVRAMTIESFLDQMRHITEGLADSEKKSHFNTGKAAKLGDDTCRNCGKKGHNHKDCRGEPVCFYCKAKCHRQFDCPNARKKETKASQPTRFPQSSVAANVEPLPPSSEPPLRGAPLPDNIT